MRKPKVGDYVLPAKELLDSYFSELRRNIWKNENIPVKITNMNNEYHTIGIEGSYNFCHLFDFSRYLKFADRLQDKLLRVIKDENS